MNKGFWTHKGGVSEGSKFPYESSPKMESKRSLQWFMDNTEVDLFPHKKQNVEVQCDPVFLGIPNSRASQWEHSSGFHMVTTQSAERMFDVDSTRTLNFDDRLITSADTGKMNVGRKNNSDPFGSDSSFGLSISHTLEDPKSSINYCGYRKVKVSQVKDSDTTHPMSMGHSLHDGDGYPMSFAQAYTKLDVNVIPTSLAYEKSEGLNISNGGTFHQGNNSFITMGQPFTFSKQDSISIHPDFRPNESTMSMSHSVTTGVNSDVSVFQTYCKGQDNGISKTPTSENNVIFMGHSYSKENDNRPQLGHDEHGSSEPGANSYENENRIFMGNRYSKRENNIIAFGVYDDEPNTAGRVVCNYDLLMGQCEKAAAASRDEPTKHHVDLAVSSHRAASASGTTTMKEDSKTNKDLPNIFPSNVRSLLSTGMMDGVPVKYVAWSREKELHAVIKGTGYLCGCQSCNHSKVINAYEFERHAGCKTKHPNNHIYFENGKTIYGVVQELRITPQNMLFDVIQTITGSQINQKSFRLWKESFLAATRELQRIYGKDEATRLH